MNTTEALRNHLCKMMGIGNRPVEKIRENMPNITRILP